MASFQTVQISGSSLDSDGAMLQQAATKVRFGRNQTVFQDGDEAVNAYKVISGTVRLCKHFSDGRRQIAGFRLPGEFFGLMEVRRYSCTAEAVSDVVLASYKQHQLDTLSETRPKLRRQFLDVLTRRLGEMEDHLVLLGRQTAMERVASFLVALSQRTGSEDDDLIDIPMSRQDIADFLGLTIETVCRAFTDLKRSGTIEAPSASQFRLRNMAALRALAANV